MPSKNNQKIEKVLERGTEKIIDREHFKDALFCGKKLRIKHGIDPTGDKIHLGRATQLWKLREFQDLGHKVVLIFGDFTARIGDPSDKPEGRKGLSENEIKKNLENYLKQIGKILDIQKTEIRHNSEWFSKMNIGDFLRLANNFSVQQLIHRRNFKARWENKKPIALTEICYPLLQGYDSVMVEADAELGGYDQLFNLKMGRIIQQIFGQMPQDIVTLKMLPGLDGRKMSTSWGNVVNILDEPYDMYGKLMSMADQMMPIYFEMCALALPEELLAINKKLKSENPRDIKSDLAKKIVMLYWGEKSALGAQKEFERVFKDKKQPSDIRKFFVPKKEYPIVDLIKGLHFAQSKSEAKRLIDQGGVRIDGEKITDTKKIIKTREGMIVQAGKLNFAKLTYDST